MNKILDLKDKKILYELDVNSSATMKKIGKNVQLSQQSVEKRINKMIQNKVINSFQTIIAYHKLGYTVYTLYLRFQNTTIEKELEIIERLKKYKEIVVIWRCEGIYDLMLGIEAKSVFELNNVISKINNQFGQFILNYDIITNIGAKHFPRNYLINKKHNQKVSFNTGGKEEIINLDKKDFQIIEILIQNPRTNFVDLATKLGLTIDIIRYRYKKLIEKQIIQGFSIVLNHKNFGNLHYRILFKLKNINKEIQKQMFEFANINPNIKIITKCFGTYELTIDIEVEYNEQLREIMSEFRNKFNSQIHHYDVLNIYSIEKFTTLISP